MAQPGLGDHASAYLHANLVALFDLRDRHDWKFGQFSVLLAQTVLLYLIAGLIYPDFGGEKAVDLRAHYFQQRKRFFGLLVLAAFISICRDGVSSRRQRLQ